MRSPLITTASRLLTLAAVAAVAFVTAAPAADWNGREEMRDGVTHVLNGSSPIAPPETITPTEAWRVGGDDDEDIIFGVLSSIAADGGGNIYLLDMQLSEVMVFSPDGEYLRSIGREGEGPGEFRRAGDMFFTPDGDVAVMQRMPGKIVTLTPDGEPSGGLKLPEAFSNSPVYFWGGGLAGEDVVLALRTFARRDEGFEITEALVRVNSAGKETARLFEDTKTRSMANLTIDEKKDAQVLWTADADGRIYANNNFDAYAINVYETDGRHSRTIERDYEHRVRNDEEKERNRPRMIMRRRGGRQVEAKSIVSDTDRDVLDLFFREDGSLWVLSSRGANDCPEGVIATFDVYDGDGRLQQQVSIEGEGDSSDDGLHFVGDQLFVVLGFRSARDAMRGGDEGEEESVEEDAEPMAVICYELGGITKAAR